MAKRCMKGIKLPKPRVPKVKIPKWKITGGKQVLDTITDLIPKRKKK